MIDASGTFSETKRTTGLLRMVQAGVIVTDYATVAVEILKDNTSPKAGDLLRALIYLLQVWSDNWLWHSPRTAPELDLTTCHNNLGEVGSK